MNNWKAVFFLLAFGQGILLTLAMTIRGLSGRKASIFLGLILYVLAMELLNAWGMQVRYHSQPNAFPFWIFQSYMILPLALWFFMQLTTRTDYVFKSRNWVIFIPVLIEIGINAGWRLYWHDYNSNLPSLLKNPFWFFITELLPIIGMGIVLIVYARRLTYFHQQFFYRKIQHNAFQLVRIYGLFTFMSILTVLWIAGVIFDLPVFSGIEQLITTCLFALGCAGYINPDFFYLPALPQIKPEKNEFGLYDDLAEMKRLKSAFEQDKIFMQSKLTIDDVATHLQLPVRYVPHLINKYSEANFNGFVNSFRVQEVIRKLTDPNEKHKTILALAFESGFSSKSSFNQVFKQHTGKLPSHYLRSEKQSA